MAKITGKEGLLFEEEAEFCSVLETSPALVSELVLHCTAVLCPDLPLDKLSAAQAKDWGMVWDVADDCLAGALALAQRLARRTVEGAAALMAASGDDPEALRRAVVAEGGMQRGLRW